MFNNSHSECIHYDGEICKLMKEDKLKYRICNFQDHWEYSTKYCKLFEPVITTIDWCKGVDCVHNLYNDLEE